jgi:hypothetical protein
MHPQRIADVGPNLEQNWLAERGTGGYCECDG